jgi:hypothetical protein
MAFLAGRENRYLTKLSFNHPCADAIVGQPPPAPQALSESPPAARAALSGDEFS